jgi:hypothetical protein
MDVISSCLSSLMQHRLKSRISGMLRTLGMASVAWGAALLALTSVQIAFTPSDSVKYIWYGIAVSLIAAGLPGLIPQSPKRRRHL